MNFSCEEQLSGIAELDFYLLSEVSNWPKVLTDQNSSQLVFTPEQFSVNAALRPDSIVIDDQKSTKATGIVHSIMAKMEFITRSESLEQLMDQYENQPGIVLAKLNNGFRKIYGSNFEPLYMMYEVKDGSKVSLEGITAVEIKGETAKRPVFYMV